MPRKPKEDRTQVTLKQIAHESGVSIGTVSRVLRDEAQVSAETERIVREAAARLRYRPNLLVRGIQTGKTGTIGVLIYMNEEFYLHILRGVQDELSLVDHVPIVLSAGRTREPHEPSELEQIHRLIDRRVDGVILTPLVDAVSDQYLHEVWDHKIPLISITRELPQTHADFVGNDDKEGARAVARHLLDLGHRNLLHFGGTQGTTSGRWRRAGFEAELAGRSDVTYSFIEDESYGNPTAEMNRLADQAVTQTPRPTAIFCANDLQAEAIYAAAKRAGVSIPDQLSVVGFSDSHTARSMTPPLSSVNQDPYQIGREAARLIIQRSRGEINATEPVKRLLPTTLVLRDSTAPPK